MKTVRLFQLVIRELMNPTALQSDTGNAPDNNRWFWYLFVYVVITLAAPYFADKDTRFYSPGIETYHEVNGSLVPTTEKIWIDGHTAAKLNRNHIQSFGLSFVLIKFAVDATARFLSRHRSKAASPQSSSPSPARS